jgi:gentisate 1,2-dioxygenase
MWSTGYSVIDGVRYDWKPGDFLLVPVFGWHRHVNTSSEPAIYLAAVTTPFSRLTGLAVFEDERHPERWVFAQKGETAARTLIPGAVDGTFAVAATGTEFDRLYREELAFVGAEEEHRRASPVRIPAEEVRVEETGYGRLGYIVDPRLGHHIRTMAVLLAEIPPGGSTRVHRHMHEEVVYARRGEGVSIIADHKVAWRASDAIFVPPLAWHGHTNTGDEPAELLMYTNRPLTESIGLAMTQHYAE